MADTDRYERLEYRSCGDSGLRLPRLSLGLWQNFGNDRSFENQRRILRRAFDLGVFHLDLANNYGPPPGSAEENLGRILARDLGPYREELVITTKAGWTMGPGPHQQGGSRKYLLSSLDRSLARMGIAGGQARIGIGGLRQGQRTVDVQECVQVGSFDAIEEMRRQFSGGNFLTVQQRGQLFDSLRMHCVLGVRETGGNGWTFGWTFDGYSMTLGTRYRPSSVFGATCW